MASLEDILDVRKKLLYGDVKISKQEEAPIAKFICALFNELLDTHGNEFLPAPDELEEMLEVVKQVKNDEWLVKETHRNIIGVAMQVGLEDYPKPSPRYIPSHYTSGIIQNERELEIKRSNDFANAFRGGYVRGRRVTRELLKKYTPPPNSENEEPTQKEIYEDSILKVSPPPNE